MSIYGPDARRAWLDSVGIPRRLGSPDAPRYDPDAITDEMLIARSWRGESGGRFDRTIMDIEASQAQGKTVYRRVQGNLYCDCGRESVVAPVDPFGEFTCGVCWEAAQRAEQDAQSEADLAARTAARELSELLPLWDDPVTGASLRRPTYHRVAQR